MNDQMQQASTKIVTAADMVDALTQANVSSGDPLQQQMFREALRALVRLAKAEKLWEIKRDTALALGIDPDAAQPPRNS